MQMVIDSEAQTCQQQKQTSTKKLSSRTGYFPWHPIETTLIIIEKYTSSLAFK